MRSLMVTLPVLVYAGYTDWKTRTIKNRVSLTLLATAAVQTVFLYDFFGIPVRERLFVGLGFLVFLFALYVLKPEALGGGDLKLLSSLGFCIGHVQVYVLSFALAFALAYMKATRSASAPMGSAVAAGAVLCTLLFLIF